LLTFHGERAHETSSAGHHGGHLHDAPPAMALALIALAIGAVVAGYAGLPASLGGSDRFATYLQPSFTAAPIAARADLDAPAGAEAAEGLELGLMAVSSAAALGGIGLAFFFFLRRKSAARAVAERFSGLHRLLLNKYYVDEIYDAAIVQPIRIASEEGLWKVVDVQIIDGLVNGVGESVSGGGDLLRRLQTGSVRAYAASLFFGVVVLLGYLLWR
jgi:NADH-quinone oxidoreductase subunit L